MSGTSNNIFAALKKTKKKSKPKDAVPKPDTSAEKQDEIEKAIFSSTANASISNWADEDDWDGDAPQPVAEEEEGWAKVRIFGSVVCHSFDHPAPQQNARCHTP